MNWFTNSEQTKKIAIYKVRIKQMMKRIRILESQQEEKCAPIKEELRMANMRYQVFEDLYDKAKQTLTKDQYAASENKELRKELEELRDQADRDDNVIEDQAEKLNECLIKIQGLQEALDELSQHKDIDLLDLDPIESEVSQKQL